MEYYHVDSSFINSSIRSLATQIENSKIQYDAVVGIHSGGLYISEPLSKLLNICHLSVRISFYGESKTPKSEPELNFFGNKLEENKKYLVVDDLIDSGSTFKYFKEKINKNSHFCCLFSKKDNISNIQPEYFISYKPDSWIIFPWDK